jgi:hypothetical protein
MNRNKLKNRLELIFAKKTNLNWNNDTESWDCQHSIDLRGAGLSMLPIKFGVIKGNLIVSNNDLKDWTNFPTSCNTLSCNDNKFTNLEGMPDTVELCIENNILTTLKGLSSTVTTLWAGYNRLTNLDYCNENMRSIDVDYNRITSLKSPIKRIEDLWCNNNLLTQIDDIPDSIKYLYVQTNKITELKIPKFNPTVGIYCYNNPITSWDDTLKYSSAKW